MRMLQERRHPRLPVNWKAIVMLKPDSPSAISIVGKKSGTAERDVRLSDAVTHVPVKAVAFEISKTGISLTLDHFFERGEVHDMALAVNLAGANKKFYMEGRIKVIHGYLTKQGDYRIGAEFLPKDAAAQRLLLGFLRDEVNRLENVWCRATGEYEYVKNLYDKD